MLARDLGCTVEELGERMSAEEFGEWQCIYQREQLSPVTARMRHAQLLAATYTGARVRQDGAAWNAGQFLPSDPWSPPAPPQARRVNVREHVREMNKRRRRRD